MGWLSDGYMKTALFALKDGKAAALFSEIIDNLGKHIFEVLERDGVAGIEAIEFHPADVEGGAIKVARLRGGGTVAFLQSGNREIGPEQTGYAYAVVGMSARLDGVGKGGGNFLEKCGSLRYKVGHGVLERIDVVDVAGGEAHQRFLGEIGCLEVGDGNDAIGLGSR